MNFYYTAANGEGTNRKATQYGFVTATDAGTEKAVFLDLEFRLATNGVIVNTLANEEPLFTTSAGLFH